MKSSFRKRISSNQVQPIATKISSYTSQFLISSGIPSYDDILFYKYKFNFKNLSLLLFLAFLIIIISNNKKNSTD